MSPRQYVHAIEPERPKMSSALIGWKKPIAGTAKPIHARITCRIRSPKSAAFLISRCLPTLAANAITR